MAELIASSNNSSAVSSRLPDHIRSIYLGSARLLTEKATSILVIG